MGNANLTLVPTIPVAAIVSQARERWIEGAQQVGKLLVAKSYYFGGVEGNSEYWWLRITPDGDRADITEPTACDITKAVPSTDAPPGPGDADPRVHRLTEADLGCCVKVVCRPRRGDGETVSGVGGRRVRSACGVVSQSAYRPWLVLPCGLQGYPTTSRPTRAIKPGDPADVAAAAAATADAAAPEAEAGADASTADADTAGASAEDGGDSAVQGKEAGEAAAVTSGTDAGAGSDSTAPAPAPAAASASADAVASDAPSDGAASADNAGASDDAGASA